MSFDNPLDLLRTASRILPIEAIMQVFETYRMHITDRPGCIEKLPEVICNEAATALDEAGWMTPNPEDPSTDILFIPDEVYNRISTELPQDFTAFLETYRPADLDDCTPNEELGYYCALYTWASKRGLL